MAVVGILGQDPVLDKALGQLVQGIGHHTRLFDGLPKDGVEDSLAGVQLLILTPQAGSKLRGMLAVIKAATDRSETPMLELTTNPEEARSPHAVPWPCRAEELKRRIEAALS